MLLYGGNPKIPQIDIPSKTSCTLIPNTLKFPLKT
jgi:hypothetical protein